VDWTLEVVVQMHVEPLIREEDRGRFGAS